MGPCWGERNALQYGIGLRAVGKLFPPSDISGFGLRLEVRPFLWCLPHQNTATGLDILLTRQTARCVTDPG